MIRIAIIDDEEPIRDMVVRIVQQNIYKDKGGKGEENQ